MTDELILDRIKKIFKFHKSVNADIGFTTDLMNDLGMDSLDMIEAWLILEEEFKIDLLEKDARKIKTIQDCVDIVKKYTKN